MKKIKEKMKDETYLWTYLLAYLWTYLWTYLLAYGRYSRRGDEQERQRRYLIGQLDSDRIARWLVSFVR